MRLQKWPQKHCCFFRNLWIYLNIVQTYCMIMLHLEGEVICDESVFSIRSYGCLLHTSIMASTSTTFSIVTSAWAKTTPTSESTTSMVILRSCIGGTSARSTTVARSSASIWALSRAGSVFLITSFHKQFVAKI